MKLNQLTKSTLTTMKLGGEHGGLLFDDEGVEQTVLITGHTPASKEWRQAHRKIHGVPESNKLVIGKKGERSIAIPSDPKSHEKRIQLLAAITTNIEGLEDWVFSPEGVLELFSNDGCAWIVNQWEDHLDEGKNDSTPSGNPAKPKSK